MKRIFWVSALFILSIITFSQSNDFNVEYSKIEGKLTKSDLFKKEFGRYDGYQLPMNLNEHAYFIVYSEDFSPSMVLVTPGDIVFKQVSSKGDDFVATGMKVPVSGEWVLYVLGDSSSTGNYYLQFGITDSASLSLSPKADFCTGLEYLTAHSNAYFIFLQSIPTSKQIYKIKGAVDAFINGDDASYNATYYQGDDLKSAEEKYNFIIENIDKCLSSQKWQKSKADIINSGSGGEGKTVWKEKVSHNQRVIEVIFNDLSKATDADYPNDYIVELTISKL